MKQSSKDTRERAIASWKSGTPINEICNVLKITRKTFYNWRKRDAEGGEQIPKPKGHAPALLNEEHLIKIQDIFKSNNSLCAREVMEKLGLNCSLGVIYRALAKIGMTYKKKK